MKSVDKDVASLVAWNVQVVGGGLWVGSRKSIPRSKSPKSGAPLDEQRSKHPLYFFANAFYTYSLLSNTPTVLCVVLNFI